MHDEHIIALAQYRLNQAQEDLTGAEQNLEIGASIKSQTTALTTAFFMLCGQYWR